MIKVALFSLVFLIPGSKSKEECVLDIDGSCRPPIVECGVYMAPSTLGSDTNLGMYAGKNVPTDQVIQTEIAIPLLFREWESHHPDYEDGTLWDRYIWEGPIMDLEPYDDTNREDSRAVFVPGIGCTINSILDLNNIESTHGSVYDTSGLGRSDPGTTGITPYHDAVTHAIVDIPAGSELFASYGDFWIPAIPNAQVTLEEELEQAETFMTEEYLPFVRSHEMSDEMKQDLWEFTKKFPIYNAAFTNLPRADWKQVEQVASTDQSSNIVSHFIRKQSQRSIEWLNENGYCQDHLRPGRSTVPQAGRGAFATRDLPAGTIVGFAPLIHMGIHGRNVLDITYKNADETEYHMYDLVINYSFGHRNSTVLLTPYGGMVNYINHHREKANVRVRWLKHDFVSHKKEWLQKDIYFLRDTIDKIGLSFEYVALRDIAEGEEVFMDYGPEWEQAWEDFQQNWVPPEDAESYRHASDLNEEVFRTFVEQQANPYPDNLVTMCHESYTPGGDGFYHWLPVLRTGPERIYCNVLDRYSEDSGSEHGDFLYTVAMEIGDDEWITVKDVPQDSIYLYDRAFSASWHLPNAFRHEIMIPDDIMPEAWMNGPPQRPW